MSSQQPPTRPEPGTPDSIVTRAAMSPDSDMTPDQGPTVTYDTGQGDEEETAIPQRPQR